MHRLVKTSRQLGVLTKKQYGLFSMLNSFSGEPIKLDPETYKGEPKFAPSQVEYDNLPPVQVYESVAICDGGPYGHPDEYIKVDYEFSNYCKYCCRKFIRVHQGEEHSH
jgi:hypothetical protein